MNVVYESPTMTVVDDRNFISEEQAFDLLWNGKPIHVCDPPDYCAEDEWNIHSTPFRIYLHDVLSENSYRNMHKTPMNDLKREVYEYLRGYELSL